MAKSSAERQRDYRARHPERAHARDRRAQDKRRENGKRTAYNKKWWSENKGTVDQVKAAARTRRWLAKTKGHVECVDFPPPPADSHCSICSRTKKLVLDHDHTTGKFRGYICRDCNMGIGKLGDNLDSLMRAVNYLRGRNG